ncbi:MAG: amidohydrolase family protein [Blastocatellia bacterium]
MKRQFSETPSRRAFVSAALAATCAAVMPRANHPATAAALAEPVIDIHQHTNYHGRNDAGLIEHQRLLGATKSVLLPAGSLYGLEAQCLGNESVMALAKKYPDKFAFFANEVAELPGAVKTIEKYLKLGAIGIGEQKFFVDCDSPYSQNLAALAADYGVPVLLHFQYNKFNTAYERFHKVLEKFPRVNFIGHAQTFWGNIDQKHDQTVLYPTGPVTPGGLSDRWMRDYPNFYGDLSAGSGLNAMTRDEEHARAFLLRNQDRLMFGSDCQDVDTVDKACVGSRQLALVRRLVTDGKPLAKILHQNAARIMRLK